MATKLFKISGLSLQQKWIPDPRPPLDPVFSGGAKPPKGGGLTKSSSGGGSPPNPPYDVNGNTTFLDASDYVTVTDSDSGSVVVGK